MYNQGNNRKAKLKTVTLVHKCSKSTNELRKIAYLKLSDKTGYTLFLM